MIQINLLTAGDEKKDKALKSIIERKIFTITEFMNSDEVTALLIGLDIAIEYLGNKIKIEDLARLIEIENLRIGKERLFQIYGKRIG